MSASSHEGTAAPGSVLDGTDKLLYEADSGVCTITINRPERMNAIDTETKWALAEAVDRFENDETLRVALLIGSDCGAFCTGSDMKDRAAAFDGEVKLVNGQPVSAAPLYADTIAAARKPVVAVIDGYCVGGGLEMSLACDMRVATAGSAFGMPEARIGTIGDYGVDALNRLIPLGEAMLIHLTGMRLTAERAHQIGLLQAVASDRQALLAKAHEIADALLLCSPTAVRTLKHLIRTGRALPQEYAHALATPFREALNSSEEAAEGARAFRDKRAPAWAIRRS